MTGNNESQRAEEAVRWSQRLIPTVIALVLTLGSHMNVSAQGKNQVVRLAKLQIDSAQLESYKAALREGIEDAMRIEPGVLTFYAVAEKNRPTRITILEVYANADAYKSHLETAHFKKYKSTTREMVRSLELIETVPIVLKSKAR